MLVEDACYFGDGFIVLVRTVVCGYDFFRTSSGLVAAPVGHHAVTGIRRVAAASIPGDCVIGNVLFDWNGIDGGNEIIVRREGVDAVREAFQVLFPGAMLFVFRFFDPDVEKGVGHFHEVDESLSEPIGGEIAATMGSGDEDDTADFRTVIEDGGLG